MNARWPCWTRFSLKTLSAKDAKKNHKGFFAPFRASFRTEIGFHYDPKIIVLDDDPTGSQTVHSCLLLTALGRRHAEDSAGRRGAIVFLLTNTRGMDAETRRLVTREVCVNIKTALARPCRAGAVRVALRLDPAGHYPVETT